MSTLLLLYCSFYLLMSLITLFLYNYSLSYNAHSICCIFPIKNSSNYFISYKIILYSYLLNSLLFLYLFEIDVYYTYN